MDRLPSAELGLALTSRLVEGAGCAMEALTAGGSSFGERVERSVRALGEHSGVGRVGLYRIPVEAGGEARNAVLVCKWRQERRASGGAGRADEMAAEGEVPVGLRGLPVSDGGIEGGWESVGADRHLEVRDVVAIPLEGEMGPLGFLRLDCMRQPFFWSDSDSRVLRGFCGFLATMLLQEQSASRPAAFSIEQLASRGEISFQLTEEGCWSFLSPAWDHLTGIPATRTIGKHHSGYLLRPVGEECRQGESLDITVGLKPGATRAGEALLAAEDGATVIISFVVTRAAGPVAGTSGYQGLLTDIRERKEQERRERESAVELENKNAQLLEALVAAREATRMKSEFLATMSHEIRTPLNGVVGMTGLMLDTSLDRKQREFAEAIRTSAESLLSIVNSILDFSRLEAQRVELEQVHFDPRALVEQVFASLAELASRKRIELVPHFRYPMPAKLTGDSGKIKQVLMNLVGNAIKFSPRGEVVVRMHWDYLVPPCGELHIHVVDRGIGITPETMQRLFRPFSQGDASTSRLYGGTGLGLAISKQLCDLMGGELAVKSKIGYGADFHLLLRMVVPDSGEMETGDGPWRQILQAKRVLLANMGEFAERAWVSCLELAGVEVATAGGLRETTAHLEAEAPEACTDVVVFDTRGLEGGGAEVNRQLRLAARQPSLVTVLLDSFHDPVDRSQMAGVEPVLVVRKPVAPVRALAEIAAFVRSHEPVPRMPIRRAQEAALDMPAEPARVITYSASRQRDKTLSFLLKRFGLRVRAAESFQDLLRQVAEQRFSLVLMDAEVSGDGRTNAVERLRCYCGSAVPPVVGFAFTDEGSAMLRATGAYDAVLGLEFQRSDLAAVLNRVAGGGTTGRQASAS